MRAILAGAFLSVVHAALAATPALAQQQTDAQSVAVGPWTIATTYKADKFENCTMTRSVADLRAVFVRTSGWASADARFIKLAARSREGLFRRSCRRGLGQSMRGRWRSRGR